MSPQPSLEQGRAGLGRALLTILTPVPTGIRAYEQLGYRAFGTPGKLAAALAITLQNIGGGPGRQTQTGGGQVGGLKTGWFG